MNAEQYLKRFESLMVTMGNHPMKSKIQSEYNDLCNYAKLLEQRKASGLPIDNLKRPSGLGGNKGENPIELAKDENLMNLFVDLKGYINNLLS